MFDRGIGGVVTNDACATNASTINGGRWSGTIDALASDHSLYNAYVFIAMVRVGLTIHVVCGRVAHLREGYVAGAGLFYLLYDCVFTASGIVILVGTRGNALATIVPCTFSG